MAEFEKIIWDSSTDLTEGTDVADIAQLDPKQGFAKPLAPKSIPESIGFVQKVDAPEGYVFGLVSRDKTDISNATPPSEYKPEDPYNSANVTAGAPDSGDDIVITRQLVKTEVRSIRIGTTNEVEQDISSLFGSNFSKIVGEYKKTGDTKSSKIAKYFLAYGEWRLINKINADFMDWLSKVATDKGSVTISNYSDMPEILGVIGELKESLFRATGKSDRTWAIVTPKIAAYLSANIVDEMHNKNNGFMDGRITPNPTIANYVCTIGDTDIYQYNDKNIAGGVKGDSQTDGKIYMGILGGAGTASVYYNKYKKYIAKGGSSYFTGQSDVFYKVRDSWSTNPQDNFDKTGTTTDNTAAVLNNNSQYIVSATLTMPKLLA